MICGHALVGLILAIRLNSILWSMPSLVRREWYESVYVPFWVACVTFAVVAIWVRSSLLDSAINGLLATAPPYGWYSAALIGASLRGDVGTATGSYITTVVFVVLLALSGAILNPLISMAVGLISVGRGQPSEKVLSKARI